MSVTTARLAKRIRVADVHPGKDAMPRAVALASSVAVCSLSAARRPVGFRLRTAAPWAARRLDGLRDARSFLGGAMVGVLSAPPSASWQHGLLGEPGGRPRKKKERTVFESHQRESARRARGARARAACLLSSFSRDLPATTSRAPTSAAIPATRQTARHAALQLPRVLRDTPVPCLTTAAADAMRHCRA